MLKLYTASFTLFLSCTLLRYISGLIKWAFLFQLMPRGRMYRFPPGRNVGDVTMPGVGGGMLPVPYNMGGMLPREAAMGQPMPITALASALANAPADQQRTVSFCADFRILSLVSYKGM